MEERTILILQRSRSNQRREKRKIYRPRPEETEEMKLLALFESIRISLFIVN
jgi:hypothetical protein